MSYYLGMDGGGTRTTAWVADEHRVLGRAEAGPSNPLKTGFDSSRRELLRAARAACRDAKIRPSMLNAVCVGLAGADRRSVQDAMLGALRRSLPARAHLLVSDAAIALTAAVGGRAGMVVVAGTGSIAFAQDGSGRVLRAGGWGALFGDEGSGYDIGRHAVIAALRALDGRGPATRLGPALGRALRLQQLTDVIASPPSLSQMAALFPVVVRGARQGDPVAQALLRGAACDLAELPAALIARLGWKREGFPVACAGGAFRSSRLMRDEFRRRILRLAPRARVSLLRRPPVEGALTLARGLTSPERS